MAKTGYGINVPISKQTDPRNFPDYVFVEYPKMMLQVVDKDYIDAWRSRNSYIDDRTGKTCYMSAAPKLGSKQPYVAEEADVDAGYAKTVGEPVTVNTPHEEKEFLRGRGLIEAASKPQVVEVQAGSQDDADDEIAQLRAENARLKAAASKPSSEPAQPPVKIDRRRKENRTPKVVSELSPED